MLLKARGRATIKAVAEHLRVPQVRVREWENPAFPTPRADVLVGLLELYRLRLAVVFLGTDVQARARTGQPGQR